MASGLKRTKILITSGPSSVAIDGMRVITNRSTGEMGRLLANACAKAGARVTLLEGAVTTDVVLDKSVMSRKFFLLDELGALFTAELKKKPDIVMHAAAVADFRPKKVFKGKVASCDKIELELIPTRKLIRDVKSLSPDTFLVGFKFEPSLAAAVRGARGLLKEAGCDLVVANAQTPQGYRASLVRYDGPAQRTVRSRKDIVRSLVEQISL